MGGWRLQMKQRWPDCRRRPKSGAAIQADLQHPFGQSHSRRTEFLGGFCRHHGLGRAAQQIDRGVAAEGFEEFLPESVTRQVRRRIPGHNGVLQPSQGDGVEAGGRAGAV
jgi:hypothetical protein